MTSTRIATSEGLLSWTYSIRDSGSSPALATVEMKAFKSAGTITVGDVVYAFDQTDFWGKEIVLTFEGIELATAVRTSSWSAKMQVTLAEGGFPGPDLRLIPLGAFQIGFYIEEAAGARIGKIERKGFLTTSFHFHLPESMPLAFQGFVVALALVDLRRRQSSS